MSRAVRVDAPGRMRVVDVDVPVPGPGEALVRVAWAGICGSDRDLLDGRRPAPFARYPIVPGHEWAGTVEAVGDGVDAALGARPVVGEGFRSCQVCPACRRGATTDCDVYDETGFTSDGAWADHLTIPARLLHLLPAGADLRAAAVLEPAACATEAFARSSVMPGQRVAVVGGGTLGLLAAQLVLAVSPTELLVVEPVPARAERAVRCGATAVAAPEEAAELPARFDVVIEAAGADGTAEASVRLAGRGGRVVLAGVPGEHDVLVTQELVTKHVRVETVFGAPPDAWVRTVRAFGAGILDPSLLVTHEFALDDVTEAFDVLAGADESAGKILLRP